MMWIVDLMKNFLMKKHVMVLYMNVLKMFLSANKNHAQFGFFSCFFLTQIRKEIT